MIVEETVQNIYPISGTYQWARGGGGLPLFSLFITWIQSASPLENNVSRLQMHCVKYLRNLCKMALLVLHPPPQLK